MTNTKIDELQERVDKLTTIVEQLALVSNIDNTLSNGLASICDQLRPLRELERLRDFTTPRTPVEGEPAIRLENLREALKRPKWTGVTSLPVMKEPVRFIGGDYVPSPRRAIQGPEYRAAPFSETAMDFGPPRSRSDAS
jgi:hypothetical protein